MTNESQWVHAFRQDISHGFVHAGTLGSGRYAPQLVLNKAGNTVEHALIAELKRCVEFTFSVAFVSSGAIAQLKQHLLDFPGSGQIITSDYLNFNSPQAFEELLHLSEIANVKVRRHSAQSFHAKGYIFSSNSGVTAMIGSSNLTSQAITSNYEWNLKVSAANGSDLRLQIDRLVSEQLAESEPLTQEWIDEYAKTYVALPQHRGQGTSLNYGEGMAASVSPNAMQQDALIALDLVRAEGAKRAIIVSATGTGKTMLSAFDVKEFNPSRLLFVAHREQIIDRTILEYQKVLGGSPNLYGKLVGSSKSVDSKYTFATVQTLSQTHVLNAFDEDAFDYIIIDEAHRAGAATYQSILQHFKPTFLLGMTATPERTDGFNVFELFDYNIAYEIRLNDALKAEMLCPFHYYGVTDVTYEDGTTTSELTAVSQLVVAERVDYLLEVMDRYAQAGVRPRGLMFCSRTEEARELSSILNGRIFRNKPLRTAALTGSDSIEKREAAVKALEEGELDYVLTVDVFNEGVDIPSINQIVMLRQTQSAIVFIQQLGRGLRLANDKEYLVVIDVIGNYANNYLIPIALFGDQSLNRESLREKLSEAVESGALPGLSSINFDAASRERILRSIAAVRLDSLPQLKKALVAMQYRVGRLPRLFDFWRLQAVDPVVLATALSNVQPEKCHYPGLVEKLLGATCGLSEEEGRALALLSKEVLGGKRLNELVLLELLIAEQEVSIDEIGTEFQRHQLMASPVEVIGSVDTLALRGFSRAALGRYERGIVEVDGGKVRLTKTFTHSYNSSPNFRAAVDDLVKTGIALNAAKYSRRRPFTPGMQYERLDCAHILGWSRATSSTIYGVKTDLARGVCVVFVTLHKDEELPEQIAYQDALIDQSTMTWYTKNGRKLNSPDVAPMVEGKVEIHVFVKKSDADGANHYYLGTAKVLDAAQTFMPGPKGGDSPVVKMKLGFDEPVPIGLYDYFAP